MSVVCAVRGGGVEGDGGGNSQTIQPALRVLDCRTKLKEVCVLGHVMSTLLMPWGIRGSLSSAGM